MTFTALIASVSHILIHPAILLERWPVLMLCMSAATAASLVSARFANRVDNRTVGLVTGVVLTLLGGALILLHYRDLIAGQPLAVSVLRCFGEYLLFIVPAALLLLLLHFTANIPRVVFRKLLHLPAFCSAAVVVWRADSWQAASLTLALFALTASVPSAYTELISRNGNDTVTVPVVDTAVLLVLALLLMN